VTPFAFYNITIPGATAGGYGGAPGASNSSGGLGGYGENGGSAQFGTFPPFLGGYGGDPGAGGILGLLNTNDGGLGGESGGGVQLHTGPTAASGGTLYTYRPYFDAFEPTLAPHPQPAYGEQRGGDGAFGLEVLEETGPLNPGIGGPNYSNSGPNTLSGTAGVSSTGRCSGGAGGGGGGSGGAGAGGAGGDGGAGFLVVFY